MCDNGEAPFSVHGNGYGDGDARENASNGENEPSKTHHHLCRDGNAVPHCGTVLPYRTIAKLWSML